MVVTRFIIKGLADPTTQASRRGTLSTEMPLTGPSSACLKLSAWQCVSVSVLWTFRVVEKSHR